jgi:hypothetical protein
MRSPPGRTLPRRLASPRAARRHLDAALALAAGSAQAPSRAGSWIHPEQRDIAG